MGVNDAMCHINKWRQCTRQASCGKWLLWFHYCDLKWSNAESHLAVVRSHSAGVEDMKLAQRNTAAKIKWWTRYRTASMHHIKFCKMATLTFS